MAKNYVCNEAKARRGLTFICFSTFNDFFGIDIDFLLNNKNVGLVEGHNNTRWEQ